MKFTIFYSWQSDLPNNTNRGFIETVLEKAVKTVGADQNFDIEPSIDRDTQGIPGSPNISQTIIEKIKTCDVFVADISIVTGVREQGQRLSPNPNVLIELGYAISTLGWEKIILFCNEAYGSDEDLPFDIRQHRRIAYVLKPEDEKQSQRDRLSSICKASLTEIIQNSTFMSKIKRPLLIPSWNYLSHEIVQGRIKDITTTTTKLELKRPPNIEGIKTSIEKNMEEVRTIDGSIDPKWDSKVSSFINDCAQFLKKIETKNGLEVYLLKSYSKLSMLVTLSVTNEGNAPASDIRINTIVPDTLILMEKWPEKNDIPVLPSIPVPESPRKDFGFDDAAALFARNSFLQSDALTIPYYPNVRSTSGFYLKDNKMVFWSDKLLHKHTIVPEDRIYIIAKPDCKPGIYEIACRIFCVEYDDWEEHLLSIEIKE